jgi:rubrerythrin
MASDQARETELRFGETVYDEDGSAIGHIRGFDEHGFYVTIEDGVEAMSALHEAGSRVKGEAELMWRCWECGEMGQLSDLPDTCPSCGAEKEAIYYWTED